jgi:Mg-chelatase subunit ChlD
MTIGSEIRNSNPRRGIGLVTVGVAMLVLVPMIGLGVDGSSLYIVRARLSQAVDAAVLAGAQSLNVGENISSQTASATAFATKYFYANFPTGLWGTSSPSVSVSVTQNDATHLRQVAMTASVTAPLYFMKILNFSSSTVQISATASRRDINVMLVLDRSGSMVDAGAIPSLQSAATEFVNQFASGRDKVGLEVMGGGTYMAYSPSVNFETDSPNVPTLIGELVGGGATNTSQALWLAYQQLVNLNEPGALNVIVLFTDGRPTAFTGSFPISSKSSCTSKTNKTAAITYYVNNSQNPVANAGLFQYLDTSITDVSTEGRVIADSSGCAYNNNQVWSATAENVTKDISAFPSQDIYGNGTATGYQPVTLTAVSNTATVDATSINAADSAATRIRADANLIPVIYTIGLGGTSIYPPETSFMQRISNDPASSTFNSAEPAGLYVYSPDYTQLQAAFETIASQLLRLSQ